MWKQIDNTEYEISTEGQVRSSRGILKTRLKGVYYQV